MPQFALPVVLYCVNLLCEFAVPGSWERGLTCVQFGLKHLRQCSAPGRIDFDLGIACLTDHKSEHPSLSTVRASREPKEPVRTGLCETHHWSKGPVSQLSC